MTHLRRLLQPERLVLALVALAGLIGFAWGLPGGSSWAADSISPRSCGLGAIVETYWWGHYHDRPPLHMAILTIASLPWMALAAARAGTDLGQLGNELVKPLPMTGIEVVARLIALAMAIGVVSNTMRLWGRLAGRSLAGMAALVGDAVRAAPHFTSWPVAAAAGAGAVLAIGLSRRDRSLRSLSPLVAAASFFVLFNLGALRSEDRFLLPEAVLVLPYAGLLLARLWDVAGARGAVALAGAAGFALALGGVASVDGTLLADPRYAAEGFLAHLAPGTRVEVYGGPIFLPRIPSGLVAVRPGVEPVAERQRIAGVRDLVDPAMDPRARSPDIIVLATELSNVEATEPPAAPHPPGLMQYRDAVSHAFLQGLHDGSLGYDRVLTASCALPWPLECRRIHDSTGGEVWIYGPKRS